MTNPIPISAIASPPPLICFSAIPSKRNNGVTNIVVKYKIGIPNAPINKSGVANAKLFANLNIAPPIISNDSIPSLTFLESCSANLVNVVSIKFANFSTPFLGTTAQRIIPIAVLIDPIPNAFKSASLPPPPPAGAPPPVASSSFFSFSADNSFFLCKRVKIKLLKFLLEYSASSAELAAIC